MNIQGAARSTRSGEVECRSWRIRRHVFRARDPAGTSVQFRSERVISMRRHSAGRARDGSRGGVDIGTAQCETRPRTEM